MRVRVCVAFPPRWHVCASWRGAARRGLAHARARAPRRRGLVELQSKFGSDKFAILAFPCNEFMKQEPKSNSAIASYARTTWNFTEPLFAKSNVNAACKGTAAEGHCFEVAGTPKPDADGGWSWWSTLFVGVFSLLHRLDPSLRYVHIWNECNAHFWQDKFPNGTRISGAWYVEFYRPVAQQLLQAFPGIMLGGPVTYSPPFVVDAKTGEVVTKTCEPADFILGPAHID